MGAGHFQVSTFTPADKYFTLQKYFVPVSNSRLDSPGIVLHALNLGNIVEYRLSGIESTTTPTFGHGVKGRRILQDERRSRSSPSTPLPKVKPKCRCSCRKSLGHFTSSIPHGLQQARPPSCQRVWMARLNGCTCVLAFIGINSSWRGQVSDNYSYSSHVEFDLPGTTAVQVQEGYLWKQTSPRMTHNSSGIPLTEARLLLHSSEALTDGL